MLCSNEMCLVLFRSYNFILILIEFSPLLVYQSVARKGGGSWECAPCGQKLLCSADIEDHALIYTNFFINDIGDKDHL